MGTTQRLGLWLIGARGGVAVTAIAGIIAQRLGLADGTALVSELPQFAHLPLTEWDDIVIGGHEIRSALLADELGAAHRESRVLSRNWLPPAGQSSRRSTPRSAPARSGTSARRSPSSPISRLPRTPPSNCRATFSSGCRPNLKDFRSRHKLDTVVILNVSSTEPLPIRPSGQPPGAEAEASLARPDCPLPASSLYAIATTSTWGCRSSTSPPL